MIHRLLTAQAQLGHWSSQSAGPQPSDVTNGMAFTTPVVVSACPLHVTFNVTNLWTWRLYNLIGFILGSLKNHETHWKTMQWWNVHVRWRKASLKVNGAWESVVNQPPGTTKQYGQPLTTSFTSSLSQFLSKAHHFNSLNQVCHVGKHYWQQDTVIFHLNSCDVKIYQQIPNQQGCGETKPRDPETALDLRNFSRCAPWPLDGKRPVSGCAQHLRCMRPGIFSHILWTDY